MQLITKPEKLINQTKETEIVYLSKNDLELQPIQRVTEKYYYQIDSFKEIKTTRDPYVYMVAFCITLSITMTCLMVISIDTDKNQVRNDIKQLKMNLRGER